MGGDFWGWEGWRKFNMCVREGGREDHECEGGS